MLENIYFISLPPEQEKEIGNFKLDTNIKLPVETESIENWNPEDLTWEMIISAMLKIMAYDPGAENISYYREFIFAVRPNIINELSDSGIIKSKAGDFDLANEIFLAIEGLSPGNDRNALNIAIVQEEKLKHLESDNQIIDDQLELVQNLYSKLLNREEVLNDTYFNAAYFYINIRDFDKAEKCLTAFVDSSDDELKVKKAKELLDSYKGLIKHEDIVNKAYNEIVNENEHKAISILEEFHNENPTVWNSWFLLGWANRRISNFTQGQAALTKALSLNSKESDIYNELAICYLESGDYVNSKATLESALSIDPENLKIISNLGYIELKLGNKDLAKQFFNTVLALDPQDKVAKSYIEQI